MKFIFPKTGPYQKFQTRALAKFLESLYEQFEELKQSRVQYLEFSNLGRGRTPKEGVQFFFQVLLYRVVALAEGGVTAWNEGNPLMSALAARSLLETIALASDVAEKSENLLENNQPQNILNIVGGAAFLNSEFAISHNLSKIRKLGSLVTRMGNRIYEENKGELAGKIYNDLSNIVHPNFPGTTALFSAPVASENRDYFRIGMPNDTYYLSKIIQAYSLIHHFGRLMQISEDIAGKLAEMEATEGRSTST